MAKLRLTLMIHVETGSPWGGNAAVGVSIAKRVAELSSVVGPALSGVGAARGAKLSVQFGREFVDHNDPALGVLSRYTAPSSLRMVLENGGNFWCHTHSGGAAFLQSVYMCVGSGVAGECQTPIDAGTSHAAGRSAGADVGDPSVDWLAVAVAAGIRRMNSTAVNFYSTTPTTMRPYGMTDDDIRSGVFFHDIAPGPYAPGMSTMRQRPFYANTSSIWDANIGCIYPTTTQVGSMLILPCAAVGQLSGHAVGRSNTRTSGVTIQDFDACLTEIYTASQNMLTYQNSITNLWYVHVSPDAIVHADVNTFGVWVDSINAMLGSNGVWNNMNEIASLYTNSASFNA